MTFHFSATEWNQERDDVYFKAGWYAVKKQTNGSRLCLYFRSSEFSTMKCTLESAVHSAANIGFFKPAKVQEWLNASFWGKYGGDKKYQTQAEELDALQDLAKA